MATKESAMEKPIARKFVHDATCELETLKNSRVYKLRESLNRGEKFSREDKDWLTEKIIEQGSRSTGVRLMGWLFDFSDVLNKYIVVRPDYDLTIYWAADKTALRCALYGKILKIIDYDAKH